MGLKGKDKKVNCYSMHSPIKFFHSLYCEFLSIIALSINLLIRGDHFWGCRLGDIGFVDCLNLGQYIGDLSWPIALIVFMRRVRTCELYNEPSNSALICYCSFQPKSHTNHELKPLARNPNPFLCGTFALARFIFGEYFPTGIGSPFRSLPDFCNPEWWQETLFDLDPKTHVSETRLAFLQADVDLPTVVQIVHFLRKAAADFAAIKGHDEEDTNTRGRFVEWIN